MSAALFGQLAGLLKLESLEDIEVAHYPLVQPDANEHAPFILLDQKHLVVPFKSLLAAYPVACRLLSSRAPNESWEATSVLLLQSPEHQTAFNTRRRLLLASEQPDISRELRFMQVLCSVPVCSKSAALWHHRRWLLAWQLRGSPPKGALRPEHIAHLALGSLEQELTLAARACEIYPRNHSAWAHRSFLLAAAKPSRLSDEIQKTSRWLDRHIADHSAAQHLAALSRRAGDIGLKEQAMDLVKRYPARETPWALLRKVYSLYEVKELVLQHLGGGSAQVHAVRAAVWWLQETGLLVLDANSARQMTSATEADPELVLRLRGMLVDI